MLPRRALLLIAFIAIVFIVATATPREGALALAALGIGAFTGAVLFARAGGTASAAADSKAAETFVDGTDAADAMRELKQAGRKYAEVVYGKRDPETHGWIAAGAGPPAPPTSRGDPAAGFVPANPGLAESDTGYDGAIDEAAFAARAPPAAPSVADIAPSGAYAQPLDGRLARNSLSRNHNDRQTAGFIRNHYPMVAHAVNDELASTEARQWWGQQEI